MKKAIPFLLTSAMVSGFMLSPAVYAENNESIPIAEQEVENYFTVAGEIKKITEEPSGNYFAAVENGEQQFGFYFNDTVKVFDNTGKQVELKEGMNITAFVDANNIMLMIYPPRYSPDVVIVQTEQQGTAELQQFDENLLNKKKDLKIFVNDQTIIENLAGVKKSKEDIINRDVLIFYDIVLESYPGQTTPKKIVILTEYSQEIENAIAIAENDFYEVNGEKMIPLRLVSEQLGFKVESNGNGAIISKGNLSFTITRGSTAYGYNKALGYFKEAPALLEENKTYVPYEFLEKLIEISEE
ncbi:stalk domain-containing protein [Lysinibacillus telephonicus]|uniref:stalk domain-containing protein n=1 Tax=Lysinibacillus telephonicus TaxID=1714840 RepID=UPI0031FCA933